MDQLWLIFALLSAITAALVAIFGKMGLRDIDPETATAISALVTAFFLVALLAVEGKLSGIPSAMAGNRAAYYIVLSGVAGALSWLFYFLALKLGKVSQVVPIDRLSLVFALVFAVVFLGEGLNIKTFAGAALICAGALLIALG